VCVYLQKEQQTKKKLCMYDFNKFIKNDVDEGKKLSKVKNSILKVFSHIKRDGGKSLFQCVIFGYFLCICRCFF